MAIGIRGKIQATFRTGQTIKASQRALYRATREVAAEIEAAIKGTINTPYPPASTPGSPPHMRTGNLHNTFRVTASARKAGEINVWTVEYGPYLEGGTSKMEPRPFVSPVLLGRRGAGLMKKSWVAEIARRARKYSGR